MRLTRLLNATRKLLRRASDERPRALRHLPLVEERAPEPGRTIAFVFTGDGNWAMLIRGLARELAKHGISSVGLKARTYLLLRKRPDRVARDVEAVLRHYLRAWNADSVVLVGLSRGADLLPFVARRIPPELRDRVRLMALFSPARMASFRFHWGDLAGYHERQTDVPVIPELQALRGIPVLVVNGTEDPAALAPDLPPGLAEIVLLDAGHNLARDHLTAAELILERLRDGEEGFAQAAGA
ncbi:AcvB/VirJ family lysyl-phosphatidylglycerol hydrolase [Longimicrobium sp.]|uniref:AcvB/VirJ family lysyl-phosphatidylglycerol hydrolase n=1 Tax=Longimicrobium sp. TaxID=2029185 RepID=UPI002CAAE6AA|nr:AcvB/VirJ family lysyl-phosphatidylglycerol hydrolase [Longimicrobium sp.]HSU16047.1 AcvB/VirJ family lysyl-phosphatidylglycerol hydrolase [Longimicrobium sp.]